MCKKRKSEKLVSRSFAKEGRRIAVGGSNFLSIAPAVSRIARGVLGSWREIGRGCGNVKRVALNQPPKVARRLAFVREYTRGIDWPSEPFLANFDASLSHYFISWLRNTKT